MRIRDALGQARVLLLQAWLFFYFIRCILCEYNYGLEECLGICTKVTQIALMLVPIQRTPQHQRIAALNR